MSKSRRATKEWPEEIDQERFEVELTPVDHPQVAALMSGPCEYHASCNCEELWFL